MEIEVGFKINEDKIDAEKILLKNGFVNNLLYLDIFLSLPNKNSISVLIWFCQVY